ncbi:MAG: DUF3108 domain-containing protein [Usitatibacter sp.]
MKLLAALLLASTGALAIPNEITAEYQVMNSGVKIGRVNETFTRRGDDYFIQSVTRSEGPLKLIFDDQVTLESSGKIVGTGLKPLRFEQKRARDPRRDVDATFDWERAVMRSTFRGESSEVPLPADTQDRLSLMYQFMRARAVEGAMKVPMANGRKVEIYTYRLVREERITTPAGEFDTMHFERVTSTPNESRADVWLAKDRFNFPVRIVFDDPKGFRLDQMLVLLHTK